MRYRFSKILQVRIKWSKIADTCIAIATTASHGLDTPYIPSLTTMPDRNIVS